MSSSPTPAHIPAGRVRDIDIYALPGAAEDIHLAWKRLQQEGELFWTPRNGGHWIATRGKLIKELFLDPATFSNREIAIPRGALAVPLLPIEADGADHLAYRALLALSLAPKSVAGYTAFARERAASLIDGFRDQGECDFIADFGLKLPLEVFLHIVELPREDRAMLHDIAEIMARDGDVAKRQNAFQSLLDYIDRWIAQRREHPGSDVLSRFVHGTVHGRALTAREIRGLFANTLLGGLDTVAAMLGFAALFLARSPDHRRQLVQDPGLIPAAAEELLRRFGPSTIGRVATRDVDVHGVHILQDEQILLPAFLHGLDEDEYEDPLTVNFKRAAGSHGSFGYGPHRCPGSLLARTELKIFLEEWLKRIPDFRVKPGAAVLTSCGMVNGLLQLPLEWDVR